MPKLVDHEVRRQELAQATWAVVHRDGVGGATVRAVAARAGWSPGALRYYFPTQAGLLAFAMELVADRVGARVSALERAADIRVDVERRLEQVLPLDDERRTEMEVWLAFWAHAQTDPGSRAQREETQRSLRLFVRESLDALAQAGHVRPELDLEAETTHLHALIDGLALHGVTDPKGITSQRIRSALSDHLDSLG